MPQTHCLVDGSLSEAVEALAQRAVAIRNGAPRMSKEAMDKTAILGEIGNWFQGLDPTAKGALIGGAAGAGLGLGSSYLGGDDDNRRPMSSALTGGLAGAAMGAGLGLAGRNNPLPKPEPKPPLTDASGQQIRVKPGVTPEQVKNLDELSSAGKPNWLHEFLGKRIYEGITYPFRQFPVTSTAFTAKGLHGLREGRYNVRASHSGNAGHAGLGLADSLKDMKIAPAKPGKPGSEVTSSKPRFDKATGDVVRDAAGNAVHDTTTTWTPDTPGTPATLSNGSRLPGVKTVEEVESMRHLSDWVHKDPVRARRFLSSRDFSQLRPEMQQRLQHLRPETLNALMEHGARLDLTKKTLDEATHPTLRRSRLYDSAQPGGLLHRLTGGRSRRWDIEPHVNMSRWGGRARTLGKYAPLYAMSAMGENYVHDLLSRWMANRQYQSAVSDLTEPVK